MCCAHIGRRYGGTGLGLWISKGILVCMRGDVRVKSKEGKGSNFILAFPARVGEEVSAFSDSADAERNPYGFSEKFRDKTCLLLDDIPENTYIMRQVLERHGATVMDRQSGVDALEVYKSDPTRIDVIVTDLRMPIMSGQQFIIEVRKFEAETERRSGTDTTVTERNVAARRRRVRVPIIVVTAENSSEEKKACLTKHGADEYLIKPIKYQDLLGAISKTLANLKRAMQKNILVIDDDAVSATFLSTILGMEGHRCVLRGSVQEAKDEFSRRHAEYDVILLDNLLGDGTGADFLSFATALVGDKAERGAESCGVMPFVISMSGNTVAEQKEMYDGYVVNHFLQKPIRKQDLLDVIQIA